MWRFIFWIWWSCITMHQQVVFIIKCTTKHIHNDNDSISQNVMFVGLPDEIRSKSFVKTLRTFISVQSRDDQITNYNFLRWIMLPKKQQQNNQQQRQPSGNVPFLFPMYTCTHTHTHNYKIFASRQQEEKRM